MNMYILILTLLLMFFNNNKAQDRCFECHLSLGDNSSSLFQNDVHKTKGILCSDCHGGNSKSEDMDIAMDPDNGFSGIPIGDEISEKCAKCHANKSIMEKFNTSLPVKQYENLNNSIHGKISITGKEKILQCTTCHNAHGILPAKHPNSPVHPLNLPQTCDKCHGNSSYMRKYDPSLPVDQLDRYRTSIHGIKNSKGDVKTAVCSNCHGSHLILEIDDVNSKVYPTNLPATCAKCHANNEYMADYEIPTDQYTNFKKSVHGIALLQNNDINAPSCNDCHGNHGAIPPGIESISKVCGSCHSLNAELFSQSPHKQVFDENGFPECETCHGNHFIITATDKLLGVNEEAVCGSCHSESDDNSGYSIALKMRNLIDSLKRSEMLADKLLNEAEQKGMEVSDSEFKLRDAHQAKLQARTMVHSFDYEKFKQIVKDKGLETTKEVIEEAQSSIEEFYFRRIGLSIAIFFISMLAFSIYLYIKRIERYK